MKHKYDTFVVYLYSVGKQHILPKEFRKQIPYSTIAGWRQQDYSEYIGHEFRTYFAEAFDHAELNYRYSLLNKGMKNITRSWLVMKDILVPVIKKAGRDKRFQRKILEAITYMKNYVGLEKALKLVGITITQYRQWILEMRFDCFDSQTSLCVKRHPHQINLKELGKMKKMLTDPKYEHWPVVSIQSLALRSNKGTASLSSWYKYNAGWGLKRSLDKKHRKMIGIVSAKPNEYLHVDTTFYEILENKTVAISFVMDNFSKMILSFHVSEKNTFNIVRNSLRKALMVIVMHPDQKHSYLVTDGGTENHNKHIDQFISKLTKHKITKIRALKDIRFSNSPVEATHKIMKGRYLKKRKFISMKELTRYLNWAVHDYNVLRPHSKHKPRTPHDVYFNIPLGFDVNDRIKNGIKKRVKQNKCTTCIQCTASDILNNRRKRVSACKEKDCELR